MGKINLLDCTLRDGGYLNNWEFGETVIADIIEKLSTTNVEILELGFIRSEEYSRDRVVFNRMEQIKELIGRGKKSVSFSVMGELSSRVPLENITPADKSGIDIIRMIIWKDKHLPDGTVVDALEEGYRYCEALIEKGYKVCVQPVRVNQYSDDEFYAMVKRFSGLNPMALYVVDSWGTDNPEDLLHYMRIADGILPEGTALGYHGHNNMMHALSVAQTMLRENFERDIIIDASVFGIGRGAGNLNLEIIAKYLNEKYSKNYDLKPMIDVYDKHISKIYQKTPWGYSIPYLVTASHMANPQYTGYYCNELHLDAEKIDGILSIMPQEDKIIFSRSSADRFLQRYLLEKRG